MAGLGRSRSPSRARRPRSKDIIRSNNPGEFTVLFDWPTGTTGRRFGFDTTPAKLRAETKRLADAGELPGVTNIRVVKGIRIPTK